MEGRRSPRKAMQDWLTDVRQRHNTAQWTIDGKNGGMPYDEPCLPDLGSARPFRSHGKEHRHGSQRSRTREDMLENLRGTSKSYSLLQTYALSLVKDDPVRVANSFFQSKRRGIDSIEYKKTRISQSI